jgi:hypothetical protein
VVWNPKKSQTELSDAIESGVEAPGPVEYPKDVALPGSSGLFLLKPMPSLFCDLPQMISMDLFSTLIS